MTALRRAVRLLLLLLLLRVRIHIPALARIALLLLLLLPAIVSISIGNVHRRHVSRLNVLRKRVGSRVLRVPRVGVVDSSAIASVAASIAVAVSMVASEKTALERTPGVSGTAFGGFDVAAVEGPGVEFDAGEEHGFVDVGGFRALIVDASKEC